MRTKLKAMSTGQFKTRCFALLAQVERTGEPLVVTKRGRLVARIEPLERKTQASLRGSVLY